MSDDFRQRVFLPVILPVGVIIGFFGFAWMLSRVLLAVEEMASTTVALFIAGYVLAIAAIVSAKPRITSRALFVGTVLGILGVVAAGTIAASVGMRELEHTVEGGEHAAEGGEGGAPAEGGGAASEGAEGGGEAVAGDTLEFTAVDIEFAAAPSSTKAGTKTVTLVNDGQAPHNVTFPDISDTPVVETQGGETKEGEIELEPGTYEFICSVPGHEGTMNGELTVE